jgi:ribosome-associated heat shock protein Hsp15
LEESKLRIDKWLWAVRIYKTRSLAAKACSEGKVKINNSPAKPAHQVIVGEIIQIRKNQINFVYEVIGLTTRTLSTPLVADYLKDLTTEEEKNKYKDTLKPSFYRPKGEGRPTKKDRRMIDKLRGSV